MGSQTLEILRQGVWASLTGGWFYDPHQDNFCNTFHLYVWILLLCLPFTIYLYLPSTGLVWSVYIGIVGLLFFILKFASYGLHHMFDTSECVQIQESPVNKNTDELERIRLHRGPPERREPREEEGIELQVLPKRSQTPPVANSSRNSYTEPQPAATDVDSIDSGQATAGGSKHGGSTIDLKVDVHRKNSSESSEEVTLRPVVKTVSVLQAEQCSQPEGELRAKIQENAAKRVRSKDAYVSIAIVEEDHPARKPSIRTSSTPSSSTQGNTPVSHPQEEGECCCCCTEEASGSSQTPASVVSTVSPASTAAITTICEGQEQQTEPSRRFSNVSNKAYNLMNMAATSTASMPVPMKTAGSLELPDGETRMPPDKGLIYWKQQNTRHSSLDPPSPTSTMGSRTDPLEGPSRPSESSRGHEQNSNQGPSTSSLRVRSAHALPELGCDGSPRNTPGSCSVLLLHLSLGALDKAAQTRKSLPEHFAKLREEHKPSRDSLQEDVREGKSHQKRRRRSSSPTSESEGEVSTSPSLNSDDDESRLPPPPIPPRHPLSVTITEDHHEEEGACQSAVDPSTSGLTQEERPSPQSVMCLDWLFEGSGTEDVGGRTVKESSDSGSSSTTTLSLGQQEAARLLPDPEPCLPPPPFPYRNQGAIPKLPKRRNALYSHHRRSNAAHASTSGAGKSNEDSASDQQTPSPKPTLAMFYSANPESHEHRRRSSSELSVTTPVTRVHQCSRSCVGDLTRGYHQSQSTTLDGLDGPNLPPRGFIVGSHTRRRHHAGRAGAPFGPVVPEMSFGPLGSLLINPSFTPFVDLSPDELPMSRDPPRIRQRHRRLKRSSRNKHRGASTATLTTAAAPMPLQHHHHRHPNRLYSLSRAQSQAAANGSGSSGSNGTVAVNMPQSQLGILASIVNSSTGMHLATSHEDTTEGAVHCFQDENGHWLTYTFEEKGTGRAKLMNTVLKPPSERDRSLLDPTTPSSANFPQTFIKVPELTGSSVGSSGSAYIFGSLPHHVPGLGRSPLHSLTESLLERTRQTASTSSNNNLALTVGPPSSQGEVESDFTLIRPRLRPDEPPKPKQYYKFKISPWNKVRVNFDRLALLALLDRNLTLWESLISVLLAILVAVFGAMLLKYKFFADALVLLFCFVVASCQYSLLKSVQPDAASPTHGFNRVVAYSRPVYFCICCALILGLHASLEEGSSTPIEIYGISFTSEFIIQSLRDGLLWFILCFPIIFSLGLLPQVNTFAMYLLEQIDMHFFGGNATSSLIAALYCVFRSLVAVAVLYGFAYGGIPVDEKKTDKPSFLFSIFCGLLISCSYHLSRSASDPSFVWRLMKKHLWPEEECARPKPSTTESESEEPVDPLPAKLQYTIHARFCSDLIVCPLVAVFVFGIHCSTVFSALAPGINPVIWTLVGVLGFLLHYVMPQLRKQLPWLCFSNPIFKSHEYNQFEVREAARVMWFEKVYIACCFVEKNLLYPVLFLGALTESSPLIVKKFGPNIGPLVVTICGLKCVRSAFSNTPQQYLVLVFTLLFFKIDYEAASEQFLVDYCVMCVIFYKMYEFLLKVQFVVTYIAPWQITWGSPFHAFAQPFSVPHSAMLFLQAFVSAVLSAPLNPFLGSAIFLASYVRPVKFWERDYNTRRVDHSNTRLSSHLERNLGADDNNLNSIFYEHLTRSLQHSLCGDLILGRWGPVSQGDCFVLASDYLNCLVHVVEMGNGLVTFQMRGLEFRGTYCQQREVEAISEGVEEDDGCCCCEPGHIPHMLSVNAAFSQRWLAWEVTATKYVLEGYSISDNSAISMLQVFEFRKVLITYYVKSIIYYAVRSSRLDEWLSSQAIMDALRVMSERNFVDLDPVFNMNIDEDYDFRASGITRSSFCNVYLEWIQYCASRRAKPIDSSRDSVLATLCFALSLLGRRTLGSVSHNTVSSVEFFLYGLHALFKGDFRITSIRDEWIFSDMDLLRKVVAPGVRMSLKLHQDHFMSPDEYDLPSALYNAIMNHEEKLVISHEGDPVWRNAVLSGTPSLLALRHVLDDGSDEYKVIMLNKRYLSFRVIKVNRECVRGLWAGQQQELVYLRNRNPERGSIQNAKQVLRNIINSSCDQPIGYPIYVSPLTTSYAETNEQLTGFMGGPISIGAIKKALIRAWQRLRRRCGEGCSSGGLGPQDEGGFGHEGVYAMTTCNIHSGYGHMGSTQGLPPSVHNQSMMETTQFMGPAVSVVSGGGRGSLGRTSLGRTSLGANRSSLGSSVSSSYSKPTGATLATLAGLLSESGSLRDKERDLEMAVLSSLAVNAASAATSTSTPGGSKGGNANPDKELVMQRVMIKDPSKVYDAINLGRRIDVVWPDEKMRLSGGRSFWKDWWPEKGMEGQVVHRWFPCHPDPNQRSIIDRTIVLIQIDDKYVPIAEDGVQDLGAEV